MKALVIEYTEREGGPKLKKKIFRSLKQLEDFIFTEYNQVILRSYPLGGSRNRILYYHKNITRVTLMHSIFFPDGRIFDSTGFCWREELYKKAFRTKEVLLNKTPF